MDAKTANLMEQELMECYAEKKIQWDKYAELETAKKEGTAAGISQGISQGLFSPRRSSSLNI